MLEAIYREVRRLLEPLSDPKYWVKLLSYLQPVVTMVVMAIYCGIFHLLEEHTNPDHMFKMINLKHLSGNLSKGRLINLDDEVMAAVEEFLDTTYLEYSFLPWKSVLEGPGLRQIILKDNQGFIETAPKESCEPVLVKQEAVNTTCTLCWTTTSMHSHLCYDPDPEHDGSMGTCKHACEHGFGFCGKLGDELEMEGNFIPKGGHGLYMRLDATKSYKDVLKRLRNLQWLTPKSRYVSIFLTTLSNADTLARVRVHFVKLVTGRWTIMNDITLIRFPNLFPTLFHEKAIYKNHLECDKIFYYYSRGPRDRDLREKLQNFMLILPPFLLGLIAIESPYLRRLLIETRHPTFEDHIVLVINLVGLGLHVGLCVVLFLERLAIMHTVCDMYENYSKLTWLESVSKELLLCLIVLWFTKLFFIHSLRFDPLMQHMRLARRGLVVMLMVPFFVLPLVFFAGSVVIIKFTNIYTANLKQALVTTSWAALGQTRLGAGWPALLIVRCVALMVMFPLTVVLATTVMSYSLVVTREAEEEEEKYSKGLTLPGSL